MMDLSGNFQKLWDVSKEYLRRCREIDLPHARISLDFAMRLLREEGGEEDIVVPAIILHDIGYSLINEKDLYKRTTFFSVYKGNKSVDTYSTRLKEIHMVEGAKLARDILAAVKYPINLIDEIVEIVRNHEDLYGKPVDEDKNLHKIIVGDADRLYRVTPFDFPHLIRSHNTTEEEAFRYLIKMKDAWFVTKTAQCIAEEEIRKIPNAHFLSTLF
jgi:hypothetical protein